MVKTCRLKEFRLLLKHLHTPLIVAPQLYSYIFLLRNMFLISFHQLVTSAVLVDILIGDADACAQGKAKSPICL